MVSAVAEVSIEEDGGALGSDLLKMYTMPGKSVKIPVAMQIDVHPETGPFLVSSSKTLLWLSPKHPAVHACFRPITSTADLFDEIIQSVCEMSVQSEWGNVHPLTTHGLAAAIAHVLSYDIPSPEILAHPDTDWGDVGLSESEGAMRYFLGCPVVDTLWVDPQQVVIVPQERAFVGILILSGGLGLCVLHNASRGIAVCQASA